MIASPLQPFLSPEAYLQMEECNSTKHEYIDGQVYAMAGASDPHVTVAGNLFALLRSHVRGTGCRVYIADMKARIESLNRFYYSDVIVTCDPRDQETSTYKRFPCLIVEVLSDSTEAFDRGDKFADYQAIESLQEYVLVNTRRQRVELAQSSSRSLLRLTFECFRRNEQGLWVLQSYAPRQAAFQLQSIKFESTLELLYEDVSFE